MPNHGGVPWRNRLITLSLGIRFCIEDGIFCPVSTQFIIIYTIIENF